MKCPHCKKTIQDKLIARHLASKGGAAARGEKKARTSEQARKAVMARWAKARAAKKYLTSKAIKIK